MSHASVISSLAFERALGLAREFGHEWAAVATEHVGLIEAHIESGITAPQIRAILEPLQEAGIVFDLEHSTASSRLRWTVDPVTGRTDISVSRPGPAWCRWSALTRTGSDTREDREWLLAAAGPEPARGSRDVISITIEADAIVTSLIADAVGDRHIQAISWVHDALPGCGLLPAVRAALIHPSREWGWRTRKHVDKILTHMSLEHWGETLLSASWEVSDDGALLPHGGEQLVEVRRSSTYVDDTFVAEFVAACVAAVAPRSREAMRAAFECDA